MAVAPLAWAEPFQPPNRGLPGRREGAATRGCVLGRPSRLVALLPDTNLGLTTEAYPTFFWYMPRSQARFVEFSLYQANPEGDRQLIYSSTLSVANEAGIASVSLPQHSGLPALEIGQDYQWSVAIICNPNNRRGDLRVDGWVHRITPEDDLAAALATANRSEQVGLYASHGVWFDAVGTLAELQMADPEDPELQARWQELLESVGLAVIAEQPFLGAATTPLTLLP
ncbi:DUF928 domain-containing protein [Halomicronema hongdechloris]|nr:DUF928 domain-containing protein [Halomicronema hongdechloris]